MMTSNVSGARVTAEYTAVPVTTASAHPRPKNLRLGHFQEKLVKKSAGLACFNKKNSDLGDVLEKIRKGTTVYYHKLDAPVFDSSPKDTLFYQTVTNSLQDFGIAILYEQLWEAPDLVTDNSPVDEKFYKEMQGKLIAAKVVQETDSPLNCFLANYSVFSRLVNNQIVCDLSFYSKFQVAVGFLNYGGRAILANDGQSIEAIDGIPRGSAEFDTKLNVFLSTFSVHLVVVQHATVTHLAVVQRMLVKYSHPVYKPIAEEHLKFNFLLKVLFTRTNQVSINEQVLIGGGRSLVGRATSFTGNQLSDCCEMVYAEWTKLSAVEIKDRLSEGIGRWPIISAIAWDACITLVTTLLEGVEAIVDRNELALVLFISAFYHTFIGDTQLFNLMKGRLPMLTTGKPHVHNKSYALVAATIAVSTMTRTLDVEDIVGLATHAQGKLAWSDFFNAICSITNTGIKDFELGGNSLPSVNF